MPSREMSYPDYTVEVCGENDEDVQVRFVIPGSKFGSVVIVLSQDEADRLSEALIDPAPGGSDDGDRQ